MIKADKEDLEDALADKADQLVVNRKVSHDQFDAACDDLSRTLEETISKISQQVGIIELVEKSLRDHPINLYLNIGIVIKNKYFYK